MLPLNCLQSVFIWVMTWETEKRCGAITICFEWFALSNIALHLIINLFLSSPMKPHSIQLKHPFWWNVNYMIIWHPNVEIYKNKTAKGYMSSEISQCTTMVGRRQGEATFWLIGASNPSLSFYNYIMGLERKPQGYNFCQMKA